MATGAWASPWRVDADGRECSNCGVYQSWDEYYRSSAKQPHGRTSQCRSCRKGLYPQDYALGNGVPAFRRLVLSKFGLTLDDYNWLFDQQGGKCALHLGPETKTDYRSDRLWFLSVDHDHSCHPEKRGCKRCIRGLLCADCNMLLGLAERVGGPVLLRFQDYLEHRPFLDREEVTHVYQNGCSSGLRGARILVRFKPFTRQ